MFLSTFGPTEWIIILVIVLILFGWNRIPQLGKGLGEGIRNFRNSLQGDDKSAEDVEKKPGKE
ncbi:MAG: twin-arginine translocase TatA/TatE family subunit [Acidobacteria bacterium]|nr:twin-arginine translocase TatA/TatE family subunit [Acidobacteriota bacterium]